MSKADDFIKNCLASLSASEPMSKNGNREILKEATDEELQEIVDKTRGTPLIRMFTLESLKEARKHHWRKDAN